MINLINSDCLSDKGIKSIDNDSVDLVMPHNEYVTWLKNVFGEIYPKLKSGGRVAINIGDGHNKSESFEVMSDKSSAGAWNL